MSEKATNKTQSVFNNGLSRALRRPTSEGRWDAAVEYGKKVRQLSKADLIDHHALDELARTNAEALGVDPDAVQQVLTLTRRPAGGSLGALHGPARRMWQGNGGNIATIGHKIVSVFDQPGPVEEIYGPSIYYTGPRLFYVAAAAMDAASTDIGINNEGTYQHWNHQLQTRGVLKPGAVDHLGPTFELGEPTYTAGGLSRPLYLSSASGTLPEAWVQHEYLSVPAYASRAANEEHLLDGRRINLFAGSHDVEFARDVIAAIRSILHDGETLKLPNPDLYVGVDIH